MGCVVVQKRIDTITVERFNCDINEQQITWFDRSLHAVTTHVNDADIFRLPTIEHMTSIVKRVLNRA